MGKEEKHLQPIKPNQEDLKKLEDALGLNKIETQESDNKDEIMWSYDGVC